MGEMYEPFHLSEVAGDIIAYDVHGHGVFVMVGQNHKYEAKAKAIINRINACAGLSDGEVEIFHTRNQSEYFNSLKAQLAEAVGLMEAENFKSNAIRGFLARIKEQS